MLGACIPKYSKYGLVLYIQILWFRSATIHAPSPFQHDYEYLTSVDSVDRRA